MLDRAAREQIVRRANLAPSVHNTQPARWRFEADGAITVLADESRFLAVGDPQGRDAALSCGAAVEGTLMALGELGFAVVTVEELWRPDNAGGGLQPAARLVLRDGGVASPLSANVEARATWRGRFASASDQMKKNLAEWAVAREDVTLATRRADLEMLAAVNDTVSLRFYRRDDYRAELVNWMRLSRSHPDYARDGLNLEALQLSALEGHAARLGLATPLFHVLDATGLAGLMLGERGKTLSSTAVVLFHRPRGESPLATGREFYRMWLELSRLGFSAWPMAVIADDKEAAADCATHFGIGEDRRLVNLLRIGAGAKDVPRARLKTGSLIAPNT